MKKFTQLNNFVRQNFRKAEIDRAKKGFTIIELIVVVAIIAVLAGIVTTNVMGYIDKAKIARANVETNNIGTALSLFYAQYGDYPYSQYLDGGCGNDPPDNIYCYSMAWGAESDWGMGTGTGDPYLSVDSLGDQYLSQFYKLDWWYGDNADYFVENGFYVLYLWDDDYDGKIGCIVVEIYDADWSFYGSKFIVTQDCPALSQYSIPFQTTPYYQ